MIVGDLVRLSEYGLCRDYNSAIASDDPYQLGIITKVVLGIYPYKIHWMKSHHRPNLVVTHSRRELKYASR